MNNMQTALIAIIAKLLGKDPSEIDPAQSLTSAGVDSLEMVEIITAVEDEFDVRFEDSMLDKIDSVVQLQQAVESALTMRAHAA
ncbi:MAG: acyl carrier protein [Pseudomonadota bacterium]